MIPSDDATNIEDFAEQILTTPVNDSEMSLFNSIADAAENMALPNQDGKQQAWVAAQYAAAYGYIIGRYRRERDQQQPR